MKADLAIALHFHQPVGNFDHIIERACDKCYIPFLGTLKEYPDIKMTFHFTGCLLEWVERKRPELIAAIRSMAGSGQVEIMSGGFYEPILPSIPPEDRISQISMLTRYVKENFGYGPKGAWIAERVWEPQLPSVLHDAGIKYIILDDTHFLCSGITKDATYGYYITEDNAKPIAVFPSDKVLRYYIPFKMPAESMDYMRRTFHEKGGATFIYGDDGEKFGEWPGTHKWVFQEKWLEKFFDEIMANRGWLSTLTLSECLEENDPLGRVYLPTTSYEEMLEWSGGFWRNFFARYPESNHMNKKMIHVSRKMEALRKKKKKGPRLAEAEKDLFRGQCNCAYWHGIFGGLYLFHLRRAIYRHLIKSEAAMDGLLYGGRRFCRTTVLDLDADGHDEVIMENRELALYLAPAEGGALKELDSKKACHNFINTLARREEPYHKKILGKAGQVEGSAGGVRTIHDDIQVFDETLKENLVYDRYGRYGLIDHFLDAGATIETFSRCDHNEAGDFVRGNYAFEVKKSRKGKILTLNREGLVGPYPVELVKEVTLPVAGSSFLVKYVIFNKSEKELDLVFGPEFNITMPDSDSERYTLCVDDREEGSRLTARVAYNDVGKVVIRDAQGELSFELKPSRRCRLWHFPVRTVSQSEKAYELNYQGSSIFPHLGIRLGPGARDGFDLGVNILPH